MVKIFGDHIECFIGSMSDEEDVSAIAEGEDGWLHIGWIELDFIEVGEFEVVAEERGGKVR